MGRLLASCHSKRALMAGAIVLCCAAAAGWLIFARPSTAAEQSRQRLFICAHSGKTFRHALQRGDSLPVKSPYSGALTGFPAELCYWTRDGAAAPTPTAVLLNQHRKISDPTFCPDCDRLVVPHNPAPRAGAAPPPDRQQYASQQQARRALARRD